MCNVCPRWLYRRVRLHPGHMLRERLGLCPLPAECAWERAFPSYHGRPCDLSTCSRDMAQDEEFCGYNVPWDNNRGRRIHRPSTHEREPVQQRLLPVVPYHTDHWSRFYRGRDLLNHRTDCCSLRRTHQSDQASGVHDVFPRVRQAVGGGIAASTPVTDQAMVLSLCLPKFWISALTVGYLQIDVGTNVLVAGLSIQVACLFAFSACSLEFLWRVKKHPEWRNPEFADLVTSRKFKLFLYGAFARLEPRLIHHHLGLPKKLTARKQSSLCCDGPPVHKDSVPVRRAK